MTFFNYFNLYIEGKAKLAILSRATQYKNVFEWKLSGKAQLTFRAWMSK